MNQSTTSNKPAIELIPLKEESRVLDNLIAQADIMLNSTTVTSEEITAFRRNITNYVTVYRPVAIEC